VVATPLVRFFPLLAGAVGFEGGDLEEHAAGEAAGRCPCVDLLGSALERCSDVLDAGEIDGATPCRVRPKRLNFHTAIS
jgi:hypothetical protein